MQYCLIYILQYFVLYSLYQFIDHQVTKSLLAWHERPITPDRIITVVLVCGLADFDPLTAHHYTV